MQNRETFKVRGDEMGKEKEICEGSCGRGEKRSREK